MPPEIIQDLVSVRGFDDISRVVSRMPVDEAAGFMLKLPPRMRGGASKDPSKGVCISNSPSNEIPPLRALVVL